MRLRLALPSLALLGACRAPERPAAAPNDSAAAPAADAYAPETMIARFRATVPERPAHFGGGAAPSADSLAAAWARGVARRDTAALRALALSASEFAWLYYLDSPSARPPYELDPDVMWAQITARGERGLARALDRLGGRAVGAPRTACSAPRASGALALRDCTVTAGGESVRLSVVERDGLFKLVGLGTDL